MAEMVQATVNVNGELAVIELPKDEVHQTFLITERMTAQQFVRATKYNFEQRKLRGL